MEEFDYIVVGGGSAGCVVASRLSEDSKVSVCLLEAGGAGNTWVVKAPIGIAIQVPSKTNNWAFETVPQPGLNGRVGYQPRGKALGGSSAINAMVYIRGHRSDYDGWAALGGTGWAYDDVLPYFKKSENNESVHDAYHGAGGPLNVADLRTPNPFQDYFLEAGRQLQLPMNHDFNGAHQQGLGIYQVTQKNGERWSAARAYVEPNLSRPNLKVVTGAQAHKILFDGKRATSVEFSREGKTESVCARREIILSSGAFQSPQLLMLSGIGNAPDLKSVGVDVVHHFRGRSKPAGPYRLRIQLPFKEPGQFRYIVRRPPPTLEGNRTLRARRSGNDYLEYRGVWRFSRPIQTCRCPISSSTSAWAWPTITAAPGILVMASGATSVCCVPRAAAR